MIAVQSSNLAEIDFNKVGPRCCAAWVQSSNLAEIDFNPWSGTLTIVFNSGRVYEYYNVPPSDFAGLWFYRVSMSATFCKNTTNSRRGGLQSSGPLALFHLTR